MRVIVAWIILTVSVLIVPTFVSGVRIQGLGGAIVAAAVLGILNAFIKPILVFLTFPLTFLTLGLFVLVINAALFYVVGKLELGLQVDDFWSAFWASLIVTIVTSIIYWLI
ncbi:MAG: phage holin family protein [Syntrophaceae bacterium]|nr:phage holin family protein [Syntrophaceae bacterium]